ncbi:methyltransferase domain-containing protein [Streptomyces sp. AD681]|uniref:methyltransferase domain-containing protein n=1 Tax=Streptomyces sp. AD681 TaxID=3019069 RepID=UPI0022F19FE4|nr:methyltransferase domain-containing protein [Streptomyces sp. AD681]MDA5145902.1 methyltransferase domain-containing protein [Streptomyces sp. AD681]
MSAWLEEWNSRQDVYIGDRHRERHFRAVARDIVRLLPEGGRRVLDYGPGDALSATRIAAVCEEVVLCEAAETIRARIAERFADDPAIRVISPAQLADLAAGSVDLVVVHSVVQYLDAGELDALLREAHRLLGPDGLLVVGDLVPPGTGLVSDTAELLRFALREGFLREAVPALVRLAFSPYARHRRRLGLARIDEAEMIARAGQAGLSGHRVRPNVGNNQRRWTFVASRAAATVRPGR